MRALYLADKQIRLVEDMPEPVLDPGDILIRPRLAGICNTDLELIRGYYNMEGVIGHEFVGEVVEGPAAWMGKRVVGEINIACGECDFCRAGVPSQCRDRSTLGIWNYHGVFAEYMKLPVENLYAVPDGVTDEQAVFVEPLAAALQVLEMAHIRPTHRVIVIGAGKLGLLTAQVLRLTGADLAVVVRHHKQRKLLSKWGIPAVGIDDLQVAQADVVVDCTGNSSGFADSLRLLKPRGTLVLKSTYHGLPEADLTRVSVEEFHVVGSRCGPFPAALRLLDAGLIDTESMIDGWFPLAQGVAALDAAAQPGMLKVLLTYE